MARVIVFDFDGVIIRRSEFFKQEAWPLVFSSYGERGMDALRDAEKIYGGGRGGDRFDILRHAYEALGEPTESIPVLVEKGANTFDEIVQKKILEAGVSDEDRGVLEQLSKRMPLYLNSATPKEALERTIENIHIKELIKGVLGRPNTKVQNFQYVAEEEKLSPSEILFVGDGESDYKAAKEFGCGFVGLGNDWNNWKKGEKQFDVVYSLEEIESYLG